MDPVFAAVMRAIGADPAAAVRHGIDSPQTARAREAGLERYEAETVAGERVLKHATIRLSETVVYRFDRTVATSEGRRPGGGLLEIGRPRLPATAMAAMAGRPVGDVVRHPLLPPDLEIERTSDLRPRFDVVKLWLRADRSDGERTTRPRGEET